MRNCGHRQVVRHQLPKLTLAGSSPVARSSKKHKHGSATLPCFFSSEIGKTLPAHCTAIGKAILSRWDEELVRSLLPVPFEKTTEHAVKHIDDLMRQLEEVRRCGFAYDHQEMAEGVECIAVPIEKGGRLYGLSVSVPAYRFDTEVQNGVEHALSDARDQLERVS